MNVSFLLGSGFSVPAGFPTVGSLTDVLLNLQANGIATHTDGQAWIRQEFLQHLHDSPGTPFPRPDDAFNYTEYRGAQALEAVVRFFNRSLKEGEWPNYEHFYDVLQQFRAGDSSVISDAQFLEDCERFGLHFDPQRQGEKTNFHQAIYMADFIFNQLLAQLLKLRDVGFVPAEPYRILCQVLKEYSSTNQFFIHTLNHDLYLEELFEGRYDFTDLVDYSDGFEELGSPYFGEVEQQQAPSLRARLRCFTDKYRRPVQVYKLHGSLDYWHFGVQREDIGRYKPNLIKKPKGIAAHTLLREVKVNGELTYRNDFTNYHPFYLTGTTYKRHFYKQHFFIKKVLKHFRQNLAASDLLIVVGYGFMDEGINDLILPFLRDSQKQTWVIDVRPIQHEAVTQNMMRLDGLQGFDWEALKAQLAPPQPHRSIFDWR